MLTRRKVVLALLCSAGRPLSRKHLFKLAFLLRHQERPDSLGSFYDFLPHKYGAYSFAMNRDLEILVEGGQVIDEENCWAIARNCKGAVTELVRGLPLAVREAIGRLISRYAEMPLDDLLRHVYSTFPEYAVRTERRDLAPDGVQASRQGQLAVYTAGYQGRTVDGFFKELLTAGVGRIIDVRMNPVSRQYGLARKSMSWVAGELGVDYSHCPQLGIPSEKRKGLTDFDSYQRLLSWYEDDFLGQNDAAVADVSQLVAEKPSVLVCLENDVKCCHRGRLARAVAKRTHLPVRHL